VRVVLVFNASRTSWSNVKVDAQGSGGCRRRERKLPELRRQLLFCHVRATNEVLVAGCLQTSLASTTKQHSLHSKQQLAPPTQRLGKLHAAVHF